MHASHEALTLHSPLAHLLARCGWLKQHGVGERESGVGCAAKDLIFEIGRSQKLLSNVVNGSKTQYR